MEKDALKVAQEMKAEYWAVSSLTGELGASGPSRALLPASPLTPSSVAMYNVFSPSMAPQDPSASHVR